MKLLLNIFLAAFAAFCPMWLEAQLRADFKATPVKGCVPLSVSFADLSSGNITKWEYTFGNGNKSILASPGAIYYLPGKYTVKLKVWDNSGNVDSVVKTNYIEAFKNPVSALLASKQVVCAGEFITFTDKSLQGDGAISKWKWDFGDGGVSTQQNPAHQYNSAGKYNVTLVVTDVNGCEHSTVYYNYIRVLPLPKVSFTLDEPFGCKPPHKVKFTNTSSSVYGIKSVLWTFGDGNTSSAINPDNTYASKGKFSVSLTITSDSGCVNTYTATNAVTVESIIPDFNPSTEKVCGSGDVTFLNKTSPNVGSSIYNWSFGDGGAAFDITSPKHKYTKTGKYDVTLTVINGSCTEVITKKAAVEVFGPPSADMILSDSIGCKVPFTITYENKSPNISSWEWDFGDASKSTYQKYTKSYYATGKFLLSLTVTDVNGCKAQSAKVIEIQKTKAFFYCDTTGCEMKKVNFTDSSSSLFKITQYTWKLGSYTSNDEIPDFLPIPAGDYFATLVIKDEKGCTDSFKRLVEVGKHTKPDFTASPLVVCNHVPVTFVNKTPQYPVQPDKYTWLFGDGSDLTTTSNGNVVHSYRRPPGKVTVSLISYNNTCPDTFTRKDYIRILPPYADFKVEYDSCSPKEIKITKQSIGENRFEWNINGVKNTVDSVITIHAFPGTTSIGLQVWNDTTGCWDGYFDTLYISNPVVAKFQYSGNTCSPAFIQFSNQSSNNATYKWSFGTGDVSQSMTPVYTFKSAGSYDVSLVVEDDRGCLDTMIQKLIVNGPKIAFSVSPLSGCAPVKIDLYDSLWYPGNKSFWYFGSSDTLKDTAQKMTYPLGLPGKTKVGLVSTDINGCTSAAEVEVNVTGVSASFSTMEYKDCSGPMVLFTINLPPKEQGRKHSAKYDFGDGQISGNADNIYHIYPGPGTYKPRLYYTDSAGCTSEFTKIIKVTRKKLKAMFAADTTGSFCPPLSVKFKDLSQEGIAPITDWQWEFGDSTGSKLQNPGKIYLVPGKYSVTLKIQDGRKCRDSFTIPDFIIVKGPEGSYTFDKDSGCVPLTVQFNSSTKRTSELKWDLGDGNLSKVNSLTHTYSYPGRFIPLLILSDSFGCTYTLPPIDTINVFPYPEPDFSYLGRCREDDIRFTYTGNNNGVGIKSYTWDFGDGFTSQMQNPVHRYGKAGNYKVSLTVLNDKGCGSTISRTIKLYGVKADFAIDMLQTCVGSPVHFTDKSTGDTTVVSRNWTIDKHLFTGTEIQYVFGKKGLYDVRLIATNSIGCKDTLLKQGAVLVGDTVSPPQLHIYRVSVENDYTVEVKFARSQEVDFKSYRILHEQSDGKFLLIREVTDVNDTIQMIPGMNTLKQSYCFKIVQQNVCNMVSDISAAVKHCTVEVSGAPGINVSYLKWNAYEGWNTVKEYHVYRENLDITGQFDSIGKTPGTQLWYNDTTIRCYNLYHYRIKAIEEQGYREHSWSDTCHVKPIWINKVPANEVWRATVEDNKDVLLEWVEIFKPRIPIVSYQIQKSTGGITLFTRTIPAVESAMLDQAVKVNEKSYTYRIRQIDECGDVSEYSNVGKTVLLKADMTAEFKPYLHWSTYRQWNEGVDHYIIERRQTDGSFLMVGKTASGNDSVFTDENISLNCIPEYCYRVTAVRTQPADPDSSWYVVSISNEATANVSSRLWVPNAFSPDGNQINETFEVKGIYIKQYHMEIYSRWGEKLFETSDCIQNWDGIYMGQKVQEGVYLYKIKALGVDNKHYNLEGTFTLFR